jgi:hypothetical protein
MPSSRQAVALLWPVDDGPVLVNQHGDHNAAFGNVCLERLKLLRRERRQQLIFLRF